jgi:hypothetical protein
VDESLRAAKVVAEERFLDIGGVVGVEIGFKYVGGVRQDLLAIRVAVAKKKARPPKGQRVPKEIGGFATDVVEAAPFVRYSSAGPDTKEYDPIEGGCSAAGLADATVMRLPKNGTGGHGPGKTYAGTLGAAVRDGAGAWMALGCAHAFGSPPWPVSQPSDADRGGVGSVIGNVVRAQLDNTVDAAIVQVSNRRAFGDILEFGDIGDVLIPGQLAHSQPVFKRGRTTYATTGWIDAVDATFDGEGGRMTNQIRITQAAGAPPFSLFGDSGAIVHDGLGRALAVVVGGPLPDFEGTPYTIATPIGAVLSAMGVHFVDGWSTLPGLCGSDPVASQGAGGNLNVFARGLDNRIFHVWQTHPNDGWSSGFEVFLETDVVGQPAVVRNRDGRLEIFARNPAREIIHKWQASPGGGWAPGWRSLGGTWITDPVAVTNEDGRIEIFAVGIDNQLYHGWQTRPGGGWDAWFSLGGVWHGIPSIGSNEDGHLEVFAVGTDGQLYHTWQRGPNAGFTSGWFPMGGSWHGTPAVTRNRWGGLEVFLRGDDRQIYHAWQTGPNAGFGSGWQSLGGSFSDDPHPVANADGRLEVWVRSTGNAMFHRWQREGGQWDGWVCRGGRIAGNPTLVTNEDGRLEAFTRDTAGQLVHRWQVSANAGWNY